MITSITQYFTSPKWNRTTKLLPLVFVLMSIGTSSSAQNTGATITPNQADYAPLSTATFWGEGFSPNEQVILKVKNLSRPCNTTAGDSSYLPWTIVADSEGNFVTTWTVCDCFGDSLRVRATGQISGYVANAYFTDAGPSGAITIANSSPVLENFNGVSLIPPSTATSALPTAWSIQQGSSPTWAGGSNATTQTANAGSPNTGGQYAWGNSDNTDRSVGAMTSGSFASPNSLMAKYVNTNSQAISQLSINYKIKRYRTNTSAVSIQFYYSTNGTSWTAVSAGDMAASTFGTAASAYNFGSPSIYTAPTFNITGLNIANSTNIYLRWNLNTTGSNSQGIGLDDISVTATFAAVQPASGGIYESFAIMNFGGNDIFYNLNSASGNPNFNGANLGTFYSSQPFYLDGAQNKTFKCSSLNIINSKLFYKIYPAGTPSGSFNTLNLPHTSDDAGAGAGCQNQTWQENAAGLNLLAGLCDGQYTLEVYSTADYNGDGTGSLTANNGGSNYKATFTVNNATRSGIYESYAIVNGTYYDMQAVTGNPDFQGANLGTFCSNTSSLLLNGGQNKTFKCSPNDITGNALHYRIYAGTGAGSGIFNPISLGFVSDDGASVCGGLNQTWSNATNNANLLIGLAAGTYTIEVYSQAAYTSGGICASIHYSNNGGANYKATFTVSTPPVLTVPSNITRNTGANCSATATYTATATGSPAPAITYSIPSSSTFQVGTTTVNVTATNSCGIATGSFTVTVTDATAPALALTNTSVSLDASGNATIPVSSIASATDACGITTINASTLNFNCDDILATPTGLLISEYIEGNTGNNKGIELYNGTNAAISLTGYSLKVYSNGNPTTSLDLSLTGSVAAGGTYKIAHSSASFAGLANITSGGLTFNGDDAVVLSNGSTVIDIIGVVGSTSFQANTTNVTLIRKANITSGNTVFAIGEWNSTVNGGSDNISNYGSHTLGTAVTITATDVNGNTSTGTASVLVTDNLSPSIASIPNAVGQCSVTVAAPTAADNCAGLVTGTTASPLNYTAQGNYTITWTFNDGHGNTSTATQTVIVDDNIAPVVPTLSTVTGQCSASVTAPVAVDNCVGNLTGTTTDPTSYTTEGTYAVHWTFDDGNGNTSTVSQTVIVDDVTAPAVPTVSTVTGQCSASVTAPVAVDNCVGNVTGTTTDPTSYTTQGTYTVHWTFNDGNGNTSTVNQTVIVDDVTAPTVPTVSTVTGQCSASVTAPVAVDNCVGNVTGTTTDPTSYTTQGTYTVHWTFDDGNGNTSTVSQTVIVDDVTAPAVPTVSTATGQCSASVTAPVAVDNCVGNVTGTTTDPTSYTTEGTYTVHWTFSDGNGNTSTVNQTVIVDDNIAPTIATKPNIVLSACQPTATWTAPTALDNCAVESVVQTAGPAPGSTIANGANSTVTYTATDIAGNTATSSFMISRASLINVACTTNNGNLYFGYPNDQSATVSVTVGGGTGPYTIVATMNRAIKCNQVNSAGDESWTASGNATTTNNTCQTTGTPTALPVSTFAGNAGTYSVNVVLLADATISFTITDANGCTSTCTQFIHAEDVRCFSGNSGNAKITICHQTGSSKNPCIKICVDESALAEHLAHGDFVGNCTTNCVAPANVVAGPSVQGNNEEVTGQEALKLELKVVPNPTPDFFQVYVKSPSNEPVIIRVIDMFGRTVMNQNMAANATVKFGHNLAGGTYFVQAIQGKEKLVQKVIKVN
jgi:hypothetical protein